MRWLNVVSLVALFQSYVIMSAAQTVIPPKTIKLPTDKNLSFGDAYGRVSFEVERLNPAAQEFWLREIVKAFFGIDESGEYIIALELYDDSAVGDEKLIARKVLAHFVQKKDRTLLNGLFGAWRGGPANDRQVQNASLVVFNGDLVRRVPINARSNTLSIGLQVFRSSSLDLGKSDVLTSVVDVINSSAATLKFAPISVGVAEVYGKMRSFGFELFKRFSDKSVLVVSQSQMSFIVANQTTPRPIAIRYEFPFYFDKPVNEQICSTPTNCFPNNVRIDIKFDNYASEIGNYKQGKFVAPYNWSQWLEQGDVAGKKVLTFLAERDATKDFILALARGKKGLDDFSANNEIGVSCDKVVDELKSYFSAADVAVLYWSFLQQYWPSLARRDDGKACHNRYAAIFFSSYGLPLLVSPPAQVSDRGKAEIAYAKIPPKGDLPSALKALERTPNSLGAARMRSGVFPAE